MKTSLWITRLLACATAALAAPLYADAGQSNAKDQIANTYSSQPREKLRSEMDAAERAELSHGDTSGMSSSAASQAGARGVAGDRDLQRTREELGKSSRTAGNPPREDLSRPNQNREKTP